MQGLQGRKFLQTVYKISLSAGHSQRKVCVCGGGGLLGFIFNWKNDSQDMQLVLQP